MIPVKNDAIWLFSFSKWRHTRWLVYILNYRTKRSEFGKILFLSRYVVYQNVRLGELKNIGTWLLDIPFHKKMVACILFSYLEYKPPFSYGKEYLKAKSQYS